MVRHDLVAYGVVYYGPQWYDMARYALVLHDGETGVLYYDQICVVLCCAVVGGVVLCYSSSLYVMLWYDVKACILARSTMSCCGMSCYATR